MAQGNDTKVYCATLAVSVMSLMNGLFQAWTSPMLPILLGKNSPIPIDDSDTTWITSFLAVGIFLSALPTGWLCSRLGSKRILICSVAPALLSIQLTVMAETCLILLVCRLLAGISVGIVMTAAPAYLTDISRNENRGFIGVVFNAGSNLGMLLAYSLGPYIEFRHYQLVCSLVPMLFILTFIWVPESPYFLLSNGHYDEAAKVLVILRGYKTECEAERELEEMKLNLEVSSRSQGHFGDLFRTKGNRRGFILLLGLLTLMLWSGQGVILSYAGMIFRKSGSSIDSDVSTIILGAFQLFTGIVSSFLIDRFGRRPLIIFSCFGTAIALLPESAYFFMKNALHSDLSGFGWVPLVFLIMFVLTFGVGLGALPLVIISELFPLDVKGIALSLATIYASTSAFAVTQVYLLLQENIGMEVSFMISAIICVIGGLYLIFYLPETKGKSVREITAILNGAKDDCEDADSIPSEKHSVPL